MQANDNPLFNQLMVHIDICPNARKSNIKTAGAQRTARLLPN